MTTRKTRGDIILRLLLLLPAFGIACFLFSTEITQKEMDEILRKHYPNLLETSPQLLQNDILRKMDIEDDLRTLPKIIEEEKETYRQEAWIFQRLPVTALLWVASVYIIQQVRTKQNQQSQEI